MLLLLLAAGAVGGLLQQMIAADAGLLCGRCTERHLQTIVLRDLHFFFK